MIRLEQIKERLDKDPRDYISMDYSTYKNSKTKAKFIDAEYGEWWATPNKILVQKQDHPSRSVEKVKKKSFRKF
jgi:hypothetical protein